MLPVKKALERFLGAHLAAGHGKAQRDGKLSRCRSRHLIVRPYYLLSKEMPVTRTFTTLSSPVMSLIAAAAAFCALSPMPTTDVP